MILRGVLSENDPRDVCCHAFYTVGVSRWCVFVRCRPIYAKLWRGWCARLFSCSTLFLFFAWHRVSCFSPFFQQKFSLLLSVLCPQKGGCSAKDVAVSVPSIVPIECRLPAIAPAKSHGTYGNTVTYVGSVWGSAGFCVHEFRFVSCFSPFFLSRNLACSYSKCFVPDKVGAVLKRLQLVFPLYCRLSSAGYPL